MSIADTLHDAVAELDVYRRDDGPLGDANLDAAVVNVRDAMELLRCRLDVDLHGNEPPFRPSGEHAAPAFIPVAPGTQATFNARLDDAGIGSDAFVRLLLDGDERLRRIAAVAAANGDGSIGAAFVRELAVSVTA